MFKSNRGITLIALIITIIVLLIIASIGVAFLTGENGILSRAQSAKDEQAKAAAEEQLKIELSNYLTNNLGTADLSSIDGMTIDGMTIDGYQVGLTGIGRIVSMTKDGQTYNFLVDDKYNVTGLNGTTVTSNPGVSIGANQKFVKVYVKNAIQGKMTLYINPISDTTITNVKFYIDDNVVYSGTDLTYTVQNLEIGKEYNIYSVVEFTNDKQITTTTISQYPAADIYVTTDGNDTTGNGTTNNPYGSLKKAVEVATDGQKIYIAPGRYTLQPMLESGGFSASGIYDKNKQLEIFGQNDLTILAYDGGTSTVRDGPAITLSNSNSIVRNLTYEFKPNYSSSYSKAIFAWSFGKTKNVFFRIKSNTASYLYNNSGGTGSLTQNCTFFHDYGSVDGNYSGTMEFTNVATNVLTQGANTNVIVNAFGNSSMTTQELIGASKQTQTFIGNQVGVFYGDNAWQ